MARNYKSACLYRPSLNVILGFYFRECLMIIRILACTMLVASPIAWAEATKSLSTGFDYSSGKYGGTTSTDVLYVPITAKYQTDYLTLTLTVPYLSVTSTGNVVRGVGTVRQRTVSRTSTQSGLGDVVASAAYAVFEQDGLGMDVAGKIKFGTADPTTNLGTGVNDYSAQLDGFYSMSKTTLFATLGYKVFGESADFTLNNIAYASLGVSQKMSDKISLGFALDVAESSSGVSEGRRELAVFISNKISKTLKLQGNLVKGFSTSSPDFGGGGSVTGYF